MRNHLHLIWKLKALNGKVLPHASFLKFTSHAFKKKMLCTPEKRLKDQIRNSVRSFPNRIMATGGLDTTFVLLFNNQPAAMSKEKQNRGDVQNDFKSSKEGIKESAVRPKSIGPKP